MARRDLVDREPPRRLLGLRPEPAADALDDKARPMNERLVLVLDRAARLCIEEVRHDGVFSFRNHSGDSKPMKIDPTLALR